MADFKRWVRSVLALALLCAAAFGCAPAGQEETPAETPTAAATPAPRPSVAPAAQPSLTATPEALALASEYLPFEEIFLRYYDGATGHTTECTIEFYSEESGLVQRRFIGPGVSRIEVSRYWDGVIMRNFKLDGIEYFQNFTPYAPAPEREVLIAEPIRVGNLWTVPGGEREITAVNKRVRFPEGFGEFSVLEITTRYENKFVMVQQYMKNVGLVAESLVDSDGSLVRDIKVVGREKGRSITQNVRFFYVSPRENALRYIDRVLTLRTNADLKARFADEWRNVPGGSGLLPLSSDVSITRMFSDPGQGRATIDFSSEFLSGMELGMRSKELLRQAVTNTLANYYKLDKVYIYIGGVPFDEYLAPGSYESYIYPTSDALEYRQ